MYLWTFVKLRQKLTDAKLMELATEVAVQDIESIAISDMRITYAKIKNMRKDNRKSEMLNFEILRLWGNRPGNTKKVVITFLSIPYKKQVVELIAQTLSTPFITFQCEKYLNEWPLVVLFT